MIWNAVEMEWYAWSRVPRVVGTVPAVVTSTIAPPAHLPEKLFL